MDYLSRQHFRAVESEIMGRFFTPEEAEQLKIEIERRIITDPCIRELAARAWQIDNKNKV
jgi:hypothetical protein